MSILDKLLKSKQEIAESDEAQEIQKSFDEAIDEVSDALSKAGYEDDDGAEDEEGDEEGKKKKKKNPFAKKSEDDEEAKPDEGDEGSEDEGSDDDDDAGADEDTTDEDLEKALGSEDDEIFVDAEPIIKALMKGINKKLTGISNRLSSVEKIQKAHADLAVGEAKLLKSLKGVQDTPASRKGVTTTQDRIFKSEGEGDKTLSKAQAMDKLMTLVKAGKIDPKEVAKIEARINKGAALPDILFQQEAE